MISKKTLVDEIKLTEREMQRAAEKEDYEEAYRQQIVLQALEFVLNWED